MLNILDNSVYNDPGWSSLSEIFRLLYGHLDSLCHNDGCCRFQFSFFNTQWSFSFGHFLLSFSVSIFEFPLNWIYYYLSQCVCVREWDLGFSQTSLPLKDISFAFKLLSFNTKMETLVQLKNSQFLMGLCRNGPPPDLQYDNSSGTSLFYSFPHHMLSLHITFWYSLLLSKCVNVTLLSTPELFRISTFARFPSSGVTERSLARAGWFYTGVGDRVQCFKCNVTAEGWQAGDCPTEKHRQLSPSCSFIQSLPSTANLLSSSHSAFSPLRIAPAIPVRSFETLQENCFVFWKILTKNSLGTCLTGEVFTYLKFQYFASF